MKIYVASSWRNPHYESVCMYLKNLGHEIMDWRSHKDQDGGTFAWNKIDPNHQHWSTKNEIQAYQNTRSCTKYRQNMDAMEEADCCLLLLPCGRSAHLEAGFMKGAGKPVYAYIPTTQGPELMYKLFDGIYCQLHDLKSI